MRLDARTPTRRGLPRNILEDLVALAAQLCSTCAAVVSLSDRHGRHSIVAAIGIDPTDANALALCTRTALESDGRFVAPGACPGSDSGPRSGGGRAFAGTALRSTLGHHIGALGILNTTPHTFSREQLASLERLARHAAALVELSAAAEQQTESVGTRARTETALAISERNLRRLEAVFETLPDLVVLTDVEGRATFLNSAARRMLGLGPMSPVSDVRLEHFHPADKQPLLEAATAEARRDGVWRGDNVIVGSDHRRREVAQVIVAPQGQEGGRECLATFIRDVSDLRHQQRMLRESEHRFRQVVEHVTDVLFEQDTDGRWTFLNSAWSDMTGFPVDESLGRHYEEFVHPDDARSSRNRFEELMSGGQHRGARAVRYVTNDGEFRWIEARARRLSGADGTPLGTAGTLRDVTAQRAMADEIDRAHKQAVQSFSRISEFLANVSHEIRTPLNGVLGLTTILLDTTLSAEQRQYASGVHHSAETLLTLVNDILDISKIEAGGLTIEQVAFAVRPWLDEVVAPAFARGRAKGLQMHVDASPEMPARLIADPTRTRQILANLLDNAMKFTASGSVSVAVAPYADANGRRMARFAVQDSGIGIAPDQHAAVFEKYRQADSSTTRRYGGTGLGLAICRQLATLLEGEIGLESVEGQGTSFWFTIPLAAAPDAEDAPSNPRPAAAVQATSRVPRVLLVEDNPTNQFVARRFLEKAGCQVELAANGAEAVARASERAFDVIFMDCQLPVLDGYEATRQIRAGTTCAAVPIVAMTAHAMTGDREKCLAAGMNDYVPKPLKPELVAAALSRALAK
jgi:PAS domain S-box-containing protein